MENQSRNMITKWWNPNTNLINSIDVQKIQVNFDGRGSAEHRIPGRRSASGHSGQIRLSRGEAGGFVLCWATEHGECHQ